ncbi:SUKH-3 domain-containing protein [Micromonospora sp. WMMA1923]|uniref:SUKH-3 domain-containing protein n=1 Tax=Micromonospora sp. WMMA1923 TaxID=3404125 RepID=UPI003B929904
MIDRRQAEQLAEAWARRDSQRLGYECTPLVSEFDLGYVILTTVSTEASTVPGDLPTIVLDKESGKVSTWPRVPTHVVEDMYRRSRPAGPTPPTTVDPASQLLREVRRLPTPGGAAHLTLDGHLHTAGGAKGDVALHHHPLVQAYLAELPTGHLVRGGDRHAELIVVSDVLHQYDHERTTNGQPPLTFDAVRALFEAARFETYRIREPHDPAGGPAERPCDSCVNFLVHFNLLPWSDLAFTREWHPDPQSVIHPERFSPAVGDALMDAGWEDGPFNEALASGAIAETEEIVGQTHRHRISPAAERTLTAFPAVTTRRRGPGRDVWISRFTTNPLRGAHSADTLADFAAVLGARLFPIGSEQQHSILAVDEHGRIFALDQGGEWFLGQDIDSALNTLLLGHAPTRVRDDGTW